MTDTTSSAPLAVPTPLQELRKRRRPLKNVHKEVRSNLSTMNRVALFITERVGTMGFFLLIFAWTVIWLGWNTLLPTSWRFDPAMGFVLYLFLCNVIQILLMPLIMVGQNFDHLPVVRKETPDMLAGFLTRSDIMRTYVQAGYLAACQKQKSP